MRRNQADEPSPGHERQRSNGDLDLDDREPDDGADRVSRARPTSTVEDDEDEPDSIGVAHRPARLPAREEDEEEIAEDDIMEILDDDDLSKLEGPDA